MKNYEGFLAFAKDQGIDTDKLYQEKGDGYQIVSFGEETKDGIYNVTLVLYDDDDMVEIYVRKAFKKKLFKDPLFRVNMLNEEYRGVTFYVNGTVVHVKSSCQTNGVIDVALKRMVEIMEIAKLTFPKF